MSEERIDCTFKVGDYEGQHECGKPSVAAALFEDGNTVEYCKMHWEKAGQYVERLPGVVVQWHPGFLDA